ncbi:unnamed protein product [Pleuronectes platessa]|uniref:Uncharacterized protein n=1 Tax=Pleuronectes platessa TaxID=8262 RepID=A0A9N7Z3Y9_PLEPL|nr:unnamed protein product [Pleuronectes platessa]
MRRRGGGLLSATRGGAPDWSPGGTEVPRVTNGSDGDGWACRDAQLRSLRPLAVGRLGERREAPVAMTVWRKPRCILALEPELPGPTPPCPSPSPEFTQAGCVLLPRAPRPLSNKTKRRPSEPEAEVQLSVSGSAASELRDDFKTLGFEAAAVCTISDNRRTKRRDGRGRVALENIPTLLSIHMSTKHSFKTEESTFLRLGLRGTFFGVIGSNNATVPASARALSQQAGPENSQLLMELAPPT